MALADIFYLHCNNVGHTHTHTHICNYKRVDCLFLRIDISKRR